MTEIILDGKKIENESEFHSVMSDLLNFGPYYGRNLDALWDLLSTDVERPVKIIWLNSDLSRNNLGYSFD
ncbi:barstar family protein, partial [Cronobacter turicensis]